MSLHREVPVKVNALVDEGIADLVKAMSEIDGLVTLESCQGDSGVRNAFVIFRFGDWKQSGELLFNQLLPAMSPDLRSAVSLQLQAYDTDTALGTISVEPAAIPELSAAIRKSVQVAGPAHRNTVAQ